MKNSISLLSFAAALPTVCGIAFRGPSATYISPERSLVGISPKPTIPPSNEELRKRQTNLNPETCGWVDGVFSSGVSCPGSLTCMLYTSAASGMAGCCAGADTINCGWATSCVDAKAYKSEGCGSGCLLNNFIRKCTSVAAPYCVTWSYPSNGILDYGCAANSDSGISTILQRATDAFGVTTSMTLPTVTSNALNTNAPNSSGGTIRKTGKKVAIGLIIGIVVAILFILFCIIIGVVFCLKKKKKQQQIAASAQAMAAVHATRPQSQYPPPLPQQQSQYPPLHQPHPVQTQMQQPALFSAPVNPTRPVPTTTSYLPHATHEEKPNTHASVYEYAVTPISSPPTPVPVYTQPHAAPPAMAVSVPVMSQYHAPVHAHEVDAVSVPHAPNQVGPVHEMGSGK